MTEGENKTIAQLVAAINLTYRSPMRTFWRGVLWGFGRSVGVIIGLIIFTSILYYFLDATGLAETFKNFITALQDLSRALPYR